MNSCGQISRLKGFYRSKINYNNYQKMLEVTKRKITGNIPNDILNLILTQKTGNKKDAIIAVQKAFEECANILKFVNIADRQAIFRLSHTTNSTQEKIEEVLHNGDVSSLWKNNRIYINKTTETIIKAEEVLLKEIKKYIPQTENIIISPPECGQFANGFRIQILGNDGKKIIPDKEIKIYRDETLMSVLAERYQVFTKYASNEMLTKLEKERVKKIYEDYNYTTKERTPDEIRQLAKDTAEYWKEYHKTMLKRHGIMAESNIAEYIRYFTGHKIKPEDGLIIPYMFSFGNTKFSLSEFIDSKMKANKIFNFLRLGLTHTDFNVKRNKNGINGICYDLGGIISLLKSSKYMGNKSIIKFMKQLFKIPPKERRALIQEFESNSKEKIFENIFVNDVS